MNQFLARLKMGDMSVDQATALLASIHSERGGAGQERAYYEQYAHLMQTFRHSLPDVFGETVSRLRGKPVVEAQEFELDGESGGVQAFESHKPDGSEDSKNGRERRS